VDGAAGDGGSREQREEGQPLGTAGGRGGDHEGGSREQREEGQPLAPCELIARWRR